MALLPIHKYFVFNNHIKPVSEFVPSENEGGIYEVLRIINGIPLFLDEHLKRFEKSARIADKEIPFGQKEIKSFLQKLTDVNEVNNGNVLISCKTNLKAFFIPHNYPSQNQYKTGVKCGILKAERENPNAKVFQTNVRQLANKLIAENKFYEVLLVDHFGRITEGSRSNVFFIAGQTLITPPANEVLLGITRQKVIECSKKTGIEIIEHDVFLKDVHRFDAAFITGTSPKVLPVKSIDSHYFSPDNSLLLKIMCEFNNLINKLVSY